MRRTPTLLFAAALLSLVLAAPAFGDALGEKLVKDFSDDGALDACIYTEAEVKLIKSQIANDTDAYAPDLRSAVDAMFEQRAQGKCNKTKTTGGGDQRSATTGGGATTGSGANPPSTGSPATQTPTAPGAARPAPGPGGVPTAAPLIADDAIPTAARTAREGGVPPFPLLALAVLMALMALGVIAYGVIRFTGWEPAWAPRARHATAEAGWRASSTWAEFTDFVRFGR